MFRILSPLVFFCLASCSGGSGGSGTSPAMPLQPGSGSTSIAEVQGRESNSPLVGRTVILSGVVTGDFQQGDADVYRDLGGFYIQDDSPDNDPTSSDGIFVFDGNRPSTDVSAGDRVTVQGTVSEYFGETQITEPKVMVTGVGYVSATDVELPVERTARNSDGELIADLERFEGMLVRFPQSLFVTELRNLEQFGAVGLSQGGRLYQLTNSNTPDPESYSAHKSLRSRRSVELDDGRRASNATPVRYLTAGKPASYSIRNGDTITGVIGNLRYSRGSGGRGDETWRLMPTMDPLFDSANPRPDKPTVAGSVKVASLNVLNFFSTVDSGQNVCGPQGSDSCRGADSPRELKRQLAKIVTALRMMDADIVGLIEIENNSSASLQMIVDAVNARIGSNTYAFLNTGSIHNDAIKTGFIYKPSSIALVGEFALLDRRIDARFNDARNRPALAQSFEVTSSGAVLTVVVNHLKSKGSSCAGEDDPNLGDGQGNCNRTRTAAAAAIADWLAGDPTGSGDSDYLIIGDLNAYVREDPLTTLGKKGFTNLLEAHGKPYSFVFDSQAGALDHALASASLVPQVIQAAEWHINADEPPLLDYNLEHGRDAALFDADTPYRASDHDPVIVGLDLVP